MKCEYCHREDCHRCTRQVHHDIMQMVNQAEQMSLHAQDGFDKTGIVTHRMRIWWGLRYAMNDYFAKMETEVTDGNRSRSDA